MSTSSKASPPLGNLGFLSGDPTPVGTSSGPSPDDRLPQQVADRLLQLRGVEGAWLERDEAGQQVVVLYYALPGRPSHLPSQVAGMPTRIVGGEPIRAGL